MNKKLLVPTKFLLLLLAILGTAPVIGQNNVALEWAASFGGVGSDGGSAIETDQNGNIYLSGSFKDVVDFDPGSDTHNLTASGKEDCFLLKLDPNGNFGWVAQIGGPSTVLYSIEGATHTIDQSGNVIVTGTFFDSAYFNPGASSFNLASNGERDAFAAKYDSTGNLLWTVSWGNIANNEGPAEVVTDDSGNVYITGRFDGTVDFDPGTGNFPLTGAEDVYVLKLNPDGDFVWATQAFVNLAFGWDLVVDNQGNVYVCGQATITAPSGAAWGGAGPTTFVSKLDNAGNLVWHYQFDDENRPTDIAYTIALDPTGYIYIAGSYRNVVDFDPGPGLDTLLYAEGYCDIFILKLDTAANPVWSKRIGGSGYDEAKEMTIDHSGNVYLTGEFYGSGTYIVDFDPGPGIAELTATGTGNAADAFLLKLDSSGNYQWAYSMGSDGTDRGNDISVDQHGRVYAIGGWGTFIAPTTADFDPGPGVFNLTGAGNGDIFIQKFVCNDTTALLLTDTVCDSYTLNGATYTESGTYTQLRPNTFGCDSIITLELTISEPNPIITVDAFTLSTTIPYTTYQWFLDADAIADATQASYTVTQNGDYTVAVTNEHGCADTSEVYIVDNVGIEDMQGLARQVRIYPNPSRDQVFIQSQVAVDLTLSSIDGKQVRQLSDATTLSLKGLAEGMYMLRITDKDGRLIKVEKLIKHEQ